MLFPAGKDLGSRKKKRDDEGEDDGEGGASGGKGQKFRALKAREVASKAANIANVSRTASFALLAARFPLRANCTVGSCVAGSAVPTVCPLPAGMQICSSADSQCSLLCPRSPAAAATAPCRRSRSSRCRTPPLPRSKHPARPNARSADAWRRRFQRRRRWRKSNNRSGTCAFCVAADRPAGRKGGAAPAARVARSRHFFLLCGAFCTSISDGGVFVGNWEALDDAASGAVSDQMLASTPELFGW